MRLHRPFAFASLAILLAAALPIACGGGSGNTGSHSNGGGHTTSTGHAGHGGSADGGGFVTSGSDVIVSITISPADQTLEVLNGAIPAPLMFTATGKTMGGGTQTNLQCDSWSYDRPDVSTLLANTSGAAFTPTGLKGGQGTVTCKYGAAVGTTTATVKLHYTSDPQGVDPSIKTQLGQASTPDGSMTLLYPYDKTVFPRGLIGPTIQWNGGGAADIYYVHATSPTFEFESWGTIPQPARFDFPATPADIWKKLTDSTSGDITVSVQRHDGAQPFLPVTRTWTIAPANLTGTIYFWEVNSGDVVRLKPGDTAPSHFLQNPGGVTCIACHSVSKNGNTIVTAFNGSASPWGTFDTATGSSIFVSGTDLNDGPGGSGFQAISPDGGLVLYGQERQLPYLLLNPSNGPTPITQLNPGSGFPVYPAWSGDGKKVAFSVRNNGNWLDFSDASLWVTDVDLATNTFSNPHMIVDKTAASTTTIYPTFSPDSQWIAFERSTQARSRGALGDVWLTSADGSTLIPLDNANGVGVLTGSEISSTYEPTFMPVAVGGYFWAIVVSERTYGNTLTDLSPVSRYKQLWVTAIDAVPVPGKDPSHPAFWLPGQELNNNNMRGEWALSPCKMMSQTCSAGYDCCGGFCHDDGAGNLTCTDQSGGCSQVGEACTAAGDCCDPKDICIGGFCAPNMPH